MIKLENVVLASPEQMKFIIEGMRNPMNSWEKSDTCFSDESCVNCYYNQRNLCDKDSFFRKDEKIGSNDHSLMQRLSNAGTEHRKYMRMMPVYVRITAPLYWWKEFDTYKIGTVANSCSTMHKIAEKEFTLEDFSCEHLTNSAMKVFNESIRELNFWRDAFNCKSDDERNLYFANSSWNDTYIPTKKDCWWQMIQLLANIYRQRKNHKLDEWREFCKWIETLPYSELITVKKKPFSVLSPMLEPGYVYAQNECISPDVDQISERLKTLWLR